VSLADAFAQEADRSKPCKLARILDSLDDSDRGVVETALAEMAPNTVARVLSGNGHPIGGMAVSRHVAGGCCCVAR
jgi:hypothetical protein